LVVDKTKLLVLLIPVAKLRPVLVKEVLDHHEASTTSHTSSDTD
jgi:hypothetical protein